MDVSQLYEDRIRLLTAIKQRQERQDLSLSVIRVILVALALAGWWQANAWPWGGSVATGAAVAFALVVIWHHQLAQQQQQTERRLQFVLGAQQRLLGHIPESPQQLTRSYNDHVYLEALELDAAKGLLSAIGPTGCLLGQRSLEQLLLTPVAPAIVTARQTAIQALTDCHLLREGLAALDPKEDLTPKRLNHMLSWLNQHQPPFHKTWLSIFFVLHIALCSSGVALGYQLPYARNGLLVVLICHWLVHRWLAAPLQYYTQQLHGLERAILRLQQLLSAVHQFPVQGELLQQLQLTLWQNQRAPRRSLRQLQRRLAGLELGHHALLQPILGLFVTMPYIVWSLHEWRREYGRDVSDWLEQIGLADSLLTLAGYRLNHLKDCFPTFDETEKGPTCNIEAMGHPLLPATQVVRNDVHLSPAQPLIMLSGSNMSGKSTLLRAIAVNSALMYAGAPVRASRWQCTAYAIATSLQVQDSFLQGVSRFYAELLRLKAIVMHCQQPLPALFLLDEILAGTNSTDRQLGTTAILQQLLQLGAFGIATTHDLALTSLPPLQASMQCWHFADHITDGKLSYDYRMQPGIVTSTHTPALLSSLGLLPDSHKQTILPPTTAKT